jgi:hypothetical protein
MAWSQRVQIPSNTFKYLQMLELENAIIRAIKLKTTSILILKKGVNHENTTVIWTLSTRSLATG